MHHTSLLSQSIIIVVVPVISVQRICRVISALEHGMTTKKPCLNAPNIIIMYEISCFLVFPLSVCFEMFSTKNARETSNTKSKLPKKRVTNDRKKNLIFCFVIKAMKSSLSPKLDLMTQKL